MKTNKHTTLQFLSLIKKENTYLPTHSQRLGRVWANQNIFNCGLTIGLSQTGSKTHARVGH